MDFERIWRTSVATLNNNKGAERRNVFCAEANVYWGIADMGGGGRVHMTRSHSSFLHFLFLSATYTFVGSFSFEKRHSFGFYLLQFLLIIIFVFISIENDSSKVCSSLSAVPSGAAAATARKL